ncbi:MAG: hypothetical protein QOE93_2371 [Actinomycetota bacterium]|nr:hypothetical protein [Actinomycetota bacterium]
MCTMRRLAFGGLLLLAALLLAPTAGVAQTYTGVTPPTLGPVLAGGGAGAGVGGIGSPENNIRPASVSAPLAENVGTGPTRALAFSGTDVAMLVLFAVPLILVGMALVRGVRTRPPQT